MYITWYGQSSFKLQSQEATVLLYPYSARKAGLRGPNFKADIIINHRGDQAEQAAIKRDLKEGCFLIDGPGEYEIRGVFIYGWLTNDKQVIYRLVMDEIRIGVLGELNSMLQAEEIEKLNGLDVLLIPVGGKKRFLNSALAAKLIKTIEPRLVIPTCFQVPGLKESLDSVNSFLSEFGIKKLQPIDKLSLKKKNLVIEDGPKMIVLQPTGQ